VPLAFISRSHVLSANSRLSSADSSQSIPIHHPPHEILPRSSPSPPSLPPTGPPSQARQAGGCAGPRLDLGSSEGLSGCSLRSPYLGACCLKQW
jgi:hypothetical protein